MQYLHFIFIFALFGECIAAPVEPLSPFTAGGEDDEEYQYWYEYVYQDPNSENEYKPESNVSQRLTTSIVPAKHYLLSMATSQFVAITRSGRIHANAQIGTFFFV